ncbi:COG1470 family protein [Halanaerobacter jeridensis]|uniref:Uncharacterized protein n=1 Tax=Halanaerobacter jeridensis TaxID=706427 RepID=A0A938XT33_9FIRM|nr:hypothetical protein [Halanaerobacter jeridensis]MBM7556369.1 hypothetical protein [Halanaerobacter jeridensis]
MRTNKQLTIFLVIFFFFIGSSIANVYAAGVKPLVIDIKAQPGDTHEFELTLTPSGKEEKVDFSFYKPVQLLSGGLKYKQDTSKFVAKEWVNLEEKQVTVYPDEKKTVKGAVKVPFSAGGSYTVVIMVEPGKTTTKKNGLQMKVRYAVRINIRVERPGIYPQAEVVDFGLGADKDKKPQVQAKLKNPSKTDYLVAAEATIRDQERRLVERVTLKSPQGNNPKIDKTRMYPSSKVVYLGQVTKRITPGDYELRIFFKYSDHGQIIKAKNIKVKEGQFDLPSAEELGAFTVKPQQLDLNLQPKAYKSKVVRLNSEIGSDVKVTAAVSNVRKDYSNSLVDWLKIRGRKEFKLRARNRGKIILTTIVPEKVKLGSYHGNIILKAFNTETGKFISQRKVPVTAVIGKEHKYQLEVKSLYSQSVKKGDLLSLDLFNAGNIFVAPQAEVIIKNAKDEFVERVRLITVEAGQKILPKTSQRLQGQAKKLTPGKYKAIITFQQQGQELKKQTLNFTVEE